MMPDIYLICMHCELPARLYYYYYYYDYYDYHYHYYYYYYYYDYKKNFTYNMTTPWIN